ncbi:MAG TPA: hypothetical protein VHW26_05265, partial [Solirubrobacteraceae bacterium]|nr:hypothetical protein [Solirubrobacteraceae bacterium]
MKGRRLRAPALVAVIAVISAAVPFAAAAGSSAARITIALPDSGTVGRTVVLRGRVTHPPSDSTMDLERRGAGGRWTVLAGGGIVHGRFAIRWKPRTASFLMIRVVLVRHARTIAATQTKSLLIGAAPVYCAAPSPPGNLPEGDGYIVGGVYNVGGPAPGITVCQGQANTVTVTGVTGATVA